MAEYIPTEGSLPWSCDDALLTVFALDVAALPAWHQVFVATPAWDMIQRLWNVRDLMQAVENSPMDKKAVADSLGVAKARVEATITEAVEFWAKHQLRQTKKQRPANAADQNANDEEAQPDDALGFHVWDDSLSPEAIHHILDQAGFPNVPEKMRVKIASRILELRELFEARITREAARQLIQMEISQANYAAMAEITTRGINEIVDRTDLSAEEQAKRLASLHTRYSDIEKRQTGIAAKHQKLIAEVGAEESDINVQKRAALDQLGFLVQQMQVYEADPNNFILKDIWTTKELEFLTTTTQFRENVLFRPDIDVVVAESLRPENFWNRHYKPTNVPRDLCRRLHKIAAAFCDQVDTPELAGLDDLQHEDDPDQPDYNAADVPDESTISAAEGAEMFAPSITADAAVFGV